MPLMRIRLREEVAPDSGDQRAPGDQPRRHGGPRHPAGTVSGWYRDRARTGHPEKAGRIGRTDYWYEDEWTAWHQAYQQGKLESLTQVDRDGDPDDLVDAAEAARMLRYANRYVIHANRRLGYFPEPDAHGPARRGRTAPLWKRSTVWAAADRRPGAVRRRSQARHPWRPRQAAPVRGRRRLARVLAGPRSGIEPSAAGLAAEWDVSRRTAERIIRAARAVHQQQSGSSCPFRLRAATRRATDLRLARLTRSVRRLVIRTYSATFRLRGPGCRLTLRQAAVR